MSIHHATSAINAAGGVEALGDTRDDDDDDPDEEALLARSSSSNDFSSHHHRQDHPASRTFGMAKLIQPLRVFMSIFDRERNKSLLSPFTPPLPEDEARPTSILHSIYATLRAIACCSYTNALLIFVPIGIATYLIHALTPVVFACNALAIIPVSWLLTFATENIARDSGDTIGALVNITFGNLVEIIMLAALHNGHIRVVQASLLGSILVNLLLILGTAIIAGAVFQSGEQLHSKTEAQALACLLCVSVFSMMLPNAFYLSFPDEEAGKVAVLKFSRACALILIVVYIVYIFYQLRNSARRPAYQAPDPQIASFRRFSSDNRSSQLLHRSIRFKDLERQSLIDDAVSESTKSIELDRFRRGNHDDDDESPHDPESTKSHTGDTLDASRPAVGRRSTSAHRGRTTIYQRHQPHRSTPSMHSTRDRSLSATRSASSYSRIFLGPPATEPLPSPPETPITFITPISKTASAILLIISSLLVALHAELLVTTLKPLIQTSPLSEPFIGLLILPIIGNCAEQITAVAVAARHPNLDLAVGVSVGSAVQVGLVLTPLIVIVGWVLGIDMSMSFTLFETVTLVATVVLVNFLIINGRTNFLEGALLCACYGIVGVGAFLLPNPEPEAGSA